MEFNATFNNISVISRRSVLLMEEAGVPGENHRPWAIRHFMKWLWFSSVLVFVGLSTLFIHLWNYDSLFGYSCTSLILDFDLKVKDRLCSNTISHPILLNFCWMEFDKTLRDSCLCKMILVPFCNTYDTCTILNLQWYMYNSPPPEKHVPFFTFNDTCSILQLLWYMNCSKPPMIIVPFFQSYETCTVLNLQWYMYHSATPMIHVLFYTSINTCTIR